MSETVVLDQKMRIRLPKKISQAFRARSKEVFSIAIEAGKIVIFRSNKKKELSPFMKDILERPFHTPFPITTELLEKIGEEQWES